MPASLLSDMNTQSGLEDQRALQIALELSMLGIHPNPEDDCHEMNSHFHAESESQRLKKSANMTECVPVPSSEHVAEIVGRQGCKIKALRAKTNTYIKTPVRGEEPVFVVTGRKEDVCAAKREILSAAEHFSQIRASRRNNSVSSTGSGSGLVPASAGPPSPSGSLPGQVTIQVRVPYRVVGLVVGPKGQTIKRIQQQTHTYIVTPSRDKEPVFEVTGLPENVEKARVEIENHIAMRTGGLGDNAANNLNSLGLHNHANDDNDFHSNGIDSAFTDSMGQDILSSIYKPPSSNSAFSTYTSVLNSNNILTTTHPRDTMFNFPGGKINGDFGLTSGFSNGTFTGLYDADEGIASPTYEPHHHPPPIPNVVWSELNGHSLPPVFPPPQSGGQVRRGSVGSGEVRLSPSLTDSSSTSDHTAVRRIRSDPLSGGLSAMTAFAPLPQPSAPKAFPTSSSSLSSGSASSSPTDSMSSIPRRRSCIVCTESEVVAALVPCGHNLFCMECATLIVGKTGDGKRCPVCQQGISQAIRIFS